MFLFKMFRKGIYEPLAESNDDNDVVVGKGLLGLLGYGRGAKARPSCFASTEFFDDIRQFQKDNGLKADGIIAPSGETAETIGTLLHDETIDDSWGEGEHDKRCAHILQNVDGPVCERLERIRRRQGRYKNRPRGQAAAACWASAHERYAHCLRGKTLEQLPPLNIWD